MNLPTLSRIERERISEAARLASTGVAIKWRSFDLRLCYVAHGREHEVFTQGTMRVFRALCPQVTEFFKQEVERYGNKCSSEVGSRG